MNITLVTVVGDYVGALDHMLRHYRSLGVEHFIIHAHAPTCNSPILANIKSIAGDCGCEIASVNVGPWFYSNNPQLYAFTRSSRPNDWFVLADQDEFHVYPNDIHDMIKYCERHGYDFIEGCLIDRTSDSGILANVSKDRSIWDQFPVGAIISAKILGAVINKIVVAKGFVIIGNGQHFAHSGRGCPPSEIYVPVYHFKWVASLVDRLRTRIEIFKDLNPTDHYCGECAKFISYYEAEGRLNLDDPHLFAGLCRPHYPHWQMVREWRLAAPYFSADLARLAARK